MFRALRPATFGATDAETVANLGLLGGRHGGRLRPAQGRPGREESGIPAASTPTSASSSTTT